MTKLISSRRGVLQTVLVTALSILCGAAASPGAAASATPFDLQKFIDMAVQAGDKRIVIPPGRYRITPIERHHLLLNNLHDIQIVADGVEMVCTQTTRALTITGCSNLGLSGLTIDYDPLPFTQGRIIGMSSDKKIHEIQLFDGYPEAGDIIAQKYEIFRPDTRTLRTHDYSYTIEKTGPRSLHVIKKQSSENDLEQVGDLIVLNAQYAPNGSDAHAIYTDKSVGVRLERVTLYASNCFGFFETDCDRTTYDRCRIDRRDPLDDPIKRGDPRLRSLDADAYHSKFARRGPALLGCMARFQGDDGVNICGNYHMVVAVQGRVLRVLAKDQFFDAGEALELFSYDGRRLPDAKAVSVEPDGKMTAAEHHFVSEQHMNEGLRTRWDANAFKVTLDRDVDLPEGSLICSKQRVGNGFIVKGCDFSFNRSRGILIKASDGEVIGNTMTGNWGPAILVSPEYWWLEAGSSNNVVIRDNTIHDCRTTGIFVTATAGQGQTAPAGAHNNITISNNAIFDCPLPNIHATSTDNLKIFGNVITQPDAAVGPNAELKPEEIVIDHCTNVSNSATVQRNDR